MPQIFISAMPQDQPLVDEISLTLQNSHHNLQISVSTSLDEATTSAAIARADLVIYLASPQAQASPQRQAELTQAVRLNKPIQTLVVRGDGLPREGADRTTTAAAFAEPVFDLTQRDDSNRALFGFYSVVNRALQSTTPAEPPTPAAPPAAVKRAEMPPGGFDALEGEADEAEIEEEIDDVLKAVPPPRPAAPIAPMPSPPQPAPARSAAPPKSRSRFPLLIAGLIVFISLIVIISLLLTSQSAQLDVRTAVPNLEETGTSAAQITGTLTPSPLPSATGTVQITSTPGGQIAPPENALITIPLLLVTVVILGVALGGALLWFMRSRAALNQTEADKPMVFISYRRDPSWGQARCITNSLKDRGISVFFDVDSINEGKFAEVIKKAIEKCDYFVPILAPVTLQSEWVRQEIVYALQLQKPIIPLLVDGFEFDDQTLPAEVREIATHNAINVTHEFYDAAIERLTTRFIRTS